MTALQFQRLIEKKGLTQRATAEALGIHERTVRKFCSGESPIPKTVEMAVSCLCLHQEKEIKE